MKKLIYFLAKAFFCLILVFTFSQCKKEKASTTENPSEISAYQKGKPFTTSAATGAGGGILMQAFYWDVPAGGTWYNTVKAKVPAWNSVGITAMWLPPVSKADNGGLSMGYDPFDYFDFGDFNQHGSTETRFGSKTELTALITAAHANTIQVYADMVLNHNSGGASEANPYTGGNTWTKFTPASGKFLRSYSDFHPNNIHSSDAGVFGGMPDLCHDQANVSIWLWNSASAVSKYYKNTMKFDGFRFDYVKGFAPWVVSGFMNSVPGSFAVGELWDSNVDVLNNWVVATGNTSSAFDFACYYKMQDAFNGNDLNNLSADMLLKRNPTKAVTFVTNHDTDVITGGRKLLAYAYIMTAEGYPSVFYRDYEEWLDKAKMNNLFWIHRTLAVGNTTYLYTDNDEYIAKRNGTPGLIVYINNSDFWQERWIQTNWANTAIKDYTGNSGWIPTTQGDSWVKIQAPPHGYTVWSKTGY